MCQAEVNRLNNQKKKKQYVGQRKPLIKSTYCVFPFIWSSRTGKTNLCKKNQKSGSGDGVK